jgi:hypothetical protein
VVVRQQQERASKINFTLHEYCDVYLILGACGNRAYAAARAYAEMYPARHHPDSTLILLYKSGMRSWKSGLNRKDVNRILFSHKNQWYNWGMHCLAKYFCPFMAKIFL